MPEPDLAGWTRLVRERAGTSGSSLPPDVVDELACYFADLYAAARDDGQTEADAYRDALSALERGTFDQLSRARETRGLPVSTRPRPATGSRLDERTSSRVGRLWRDVVFDVRYALRGMRRNVAFTVAVVSILAVGIGATTAAFTVIDTVLLRALPYPQPDDLVVVEGVTNKAGRSALSAADWRDYATQNGSSLALAAYANWPMNLTGNGEPERLRSIIVSGHFFDVVGAKPALGRTSVESDDTPSAPAVVVLSHGFWSRRFGRSPSAIGTEMLLNGRSATVVGVMPAAFAVPARDVDLWMPMGLPSEVLTDRSSEWLSVVGRLRRGVPLSAAQAGLSLTAASLEKQFPRTNRDERVVARPLLDKIVGDVRSALWLGGAAVIVVLLAGCANAANLLLARATMRRDEIALRAALGADPGRLARQLLVESAVLAAVGCAVGIGAAWMFLRAFVVLGESRVPRVEQARLDTTALLVAVLASALTALLFGGAAAWLLARVKSPSPGRADAQRTTASHRIGGLLLAGQVAFALLLSVGALLVARGYAATSRIDPGFDVSDTATLQLTLPKGRYADSAAHARFVERLLDAVASVPGVVSAGVVSDLPFVANQMHFRVEVDGTPPRTAREVELTVRVADPGYFRTLKIPLAAGRYFEAADRRGAASVAIVNRTAAERLWGAATIDHRLQVAGESPRQVVGVVGDIKHAGLHGDEGGVVYVPYAQKTFDFVNWLGVVARGAGVVPPASAVKAAIAQVDPNQPVFGVLAMQEYVDRDRAPYRFSSLVVGSLAGAAFVLAITGIYGLTTVIVSRRSRELGVRLALGASPSSVVFLVLRQILAMLVLGSTAGLVCTFMARAAVRAALPASAGSATDPVVLAGAVALLGITSLLAACGPAWRAARIDPRVALQAD